MEYELTVPRQARLERVSTVNGDLDIEGVEGAITASTVNGRLDAKRLQNNASLSTVNGAINAEFLKLKDNNEISLHAVNGKLLLRLPERANTEVSASVLTGSISSDDGLAVKKNFVGSELHAQFGDGGGKVKLDAVNGDIIIQRARSHAQR